MQHSKPVCRCQSRMRNVSVHQLLTLMEEFINFNVRLLPSRISFSNETILQMVQ